MSTTVFEMDEFEMVDAPNPVKTELPEHTEYVKKIQVCILLDTTGSMLPYFTATKAALTTLLLQMPSDKELSVALIRFNDYSVQSKVYMPSDASCCLATDFTSAANIIDILDRLTAGGGSDAPEALSLALRFAADTTKISWDSSPCVSKTVVLATDAPPHGLGYASGDNFPLGDPDTGANGCGPQLCDANGELMHLDPLTYVNELKTLGVLVHTAKVGKSTDPKLDLFMKLVASLTGGKAMVLDEVSNLGDVIAGVSLEDAACAELAGAIASEMEKLMLEGVDKEAAAEVAISKVAETANSEEFISVDVNEVPLDTKSAAVFRSLSSETSLKSFRTATKTLTNGGVHFPSYEDTTPINAKRYRSLGGGFTLTDDDYVPHYPSLSDIPTYRSLSATAEESGVPSHAAISNHFSEMEEEPAHPVYRSSANLFHTSEVVSHAAPSPRSSNAASSASVKKGLTPALLARAAARVASSARVA